MRDADDDPVFDLQVWASSRWGKEARCKEIRKKIPLMVAPDLPMIQECFARGMSIFISAKGSVETWSAGRKVALERGARGLAYFHPDHLLHCGLGLLDCCLRPLQNP